MFLRWRLRTDVIMGFKYHNIRTASRESDVVCILKVSRFPRQGEGGSASLSTQVDSEPYMASMSFDWIQSPTAIFLRAGIRCTVPSDIIIRSAEAQDVPFLVRLIRRSWLVAWAPELPFEAVQAFAAIDPARLHVEAEWRGFIVASRASELLGMFQTDRDMLQFLHVDPSHWNTGIGSKLLNAAEVGIACTHSVARLEVRSFNTRAQLFYARRGWSEVRRYPGTECGCPVENVEMQKSLLQHRHNGPSLAHREMS